MIKYDYVEQLENPYFLVIGAMDGISHDNLSPFIRNMKLSGLFVEPVKYMFDKLKENYKNYDNISFENSAITDKNGNSTIYRVDFDDMSKYPSWSDGGSSLIPNKTAMKSVSNLIKEEINTITLNELFKKHDLKKIDILQIDCEGYDLIVFKQFDFIKYQPHFISVEILSFNNDEINELCHILKNNGYEYYNNGSEVLGIKNKK